MPKFLISLASRLSFTFIALGLICFYTAWEQRNAPTMTSVKYGLLLSGGVLGMMLGAIGIRVRHRQIRQH